MELKDQCITLDQAKKLKKLGFNKESLYSINDMGGIIYTIATLGLSFEGFYPAYTVSELMEYLPYVIKRDGWKKPEEFILKIEKQCSEYVVYYSDEEGYEYAFEQSLYLAIALCDMLIYLLTNGYIKWNT